MQKVLRYKYTLASAILILLALLMPGQAFKQVPKSLLQLDKLVHFALFFMFMIAYQLEYQADHGTLPHFVRAAILAALFSVGTETLQLAASARSFDPVDMLYDMAGAMAALLCIVLLRALVRRRQ